MRNNTTRRRLTASALALGIAGAGICGTTAAAPEAAAQVAAGRYIFHENAGLFSPPSTYPVAITKNRWVNQSQWGGTAPLRQTRDGAVVTDVGQPTPFPATYILSKRPHNRYHVEIRQFGLRVGDGILVPRR